ncbi:MAG: [FeFe] hydrogenase, group A, partial [Syntrophomonas sp.]
GNCELQELAAEFYVRDNPFEIKTRHMEKDFSSPALFRDPDKCILCRRCIEACSVVQTVNAYGMQGRGASSIVVPSMGEKQMESTCIMCGQCIHACPVAAIAEREEIDKFMDAVSDPDKIVVTQIAPAVRVAVAEEIGQRTGELPMDAFVSALRHVGFDYVLSTNYTADLTIMEEGSELLQRIRNNDRLPVITSCSPGWINFCETFYPDLLNHLSSCKSPQQMFGALVKTYWANKMGIDPAKIYSVSIMPCVAKKYEAARPEMNASGFRDVDLVLTTREIGRLFRLNSLDFSKIPPSSFDSWMGNFTGAGVIFGVSGGVTEAALRTAYELATGELLEDVEFNVIRGRENIREAEIDLKGMKIKVAVGHSTRAARELMEQVRAGKSKYHFIEIMACPGGCIGGGGQPLTRSDQQRAERIEAIYLEDKGQELRKSHENPHIKTLYDEFLIAPLSEKSHELLHTHYTPRHNRYAVSGYNPQACS